MPFQKLCVGLKVNNNLKWLRIQHNAASLYDAINSGYKQFQSPTTRDQWLGLMEGASLQDNCNQQGFSTSRARLGIAANNENNCDSPDSAVGFGLKFRQLSCGNSMWFYNRIAAFGYILIK